MGLVEQRQAEAQAAEEAEAVQVAILAVQGAQCLPDLAGYTVAGPVVEGKAKRAVGFWATVLLEPLGLFALSGALGVATRRTPLTFN